MAWVKVDDNFFGNPKVMRAGKDASVLFLAALCFCNRSLTDGFVPEESLRRLAADADVDDPRKLAERLVDVGLWAHAEHGYRVCKYLEYQPSAESVKQKRDEAAERMRRVRSREVRANEEASSEDVRANISRSSQELRSTPSHSRPVPVPGPVPEPTKESLGAGAPARVTYSPGFEIFWGEWNNDISKGRGSKKAAYDAWKAIGLDRSGAAETQQELIEGLRCWKGSAEWQKEGGRFIPHAQRWLKERRWEDDPPKPSNEERMGWHVSGAKGSDSIRFFALGTRGKEILQQ